MRTSRWEIEEHLPVHAYFGIEDETLWDIVATKAPTLHAQITAILGEHPAAEGSEKD